MENKGTFTRILAILGTVLVWFPLLALNTAGVGGVLLLKDLFKPKQES